MNKKGFTLIELLAVIVILAIIALITAPIILGVIEGAKKDSAKDKAWGTINAVELAYTQDQIKDSSYQIGTPVTFNDKKASVGTTEVKASGELPESGTVTIRDDGSIIAQNLKFKDYTCSTIKSETNTQLDPNNMVCVKDGSVTPTSNVRYIWSQDEFKIGDSIEGIEMVTDPTTLGKNSFLKHTIKDGKIESSEACFIKDSQMHCLKPNEYETSRAKLIEIFGGTPCSEPVTGLIQCGVASEVSGTASSNNYVEVWANNSYCRVDYTAGNSYCV